MAVLLLICIYVGFIGLGIPDSLFGPAWPSIYQEWNLPVSYAAFVTMTVTIGTIISSFFGSKLLNKFGTKLVTIISTFMTAFALLGYSLSSSLIFMILFAIPLGLGAGAIDSGLNNYVALHYKNSQMNFLHCFYGIGVSVSPYIMSLALANTSSWRKGYLIAFFIQLGISLILLFSYPLWNKVKAKNKEEEIIPVSIPYHKLFTLPKAMIASFIFFAYCGLETTTGVWSSSFLVNAKGIGVSDAAGLASLFYGGLAVGRFLAGISAHFLNNKKLLIIGQVTLGISLILLFIPNIYVTYVALFLIGVGCGPIYPNMVSLTPSYYGKEYSQSIMGLQMAIAYCGTLSVSPLFGVLAQHISFDLLPYYLAGAYLLMIILTIILFVLNRKKSQINL